MDKNEQENCTNSMDTMSGSCFDFGSETGSEYDFMFDEGDGDGVQMQENGCDIVSNNYANVTSHTEWRSIVERLAVLCDKDITPLRFDSIEDVDEFYTCHAKMIGFGVRKDDIKKKLGRVTYRRWVCSKEGFRMEKYHNVSNRKKVAKAITRVGCPAFLQVSYDEAIKQYRIMKFVLEHNHNFVNPRAIHFLRSHRNVDAMGVAEAKSLRTVGIKIPQIFDLQAHQSGGYNKLGYIEKDLRNVIDSQQREELGFGDAPCTLSYLDGRARWEKNFYYKYDVDQDNRLCRVFWTDAQSKMDYECFGDALSFDSTYCTNAYKKPLIMLAGVNNHFRTTIFGCAVVADETEETYKWILSTFLKAMNDRAPISIITDGDGAMRKAIEAIIPSAHHRLCIWHLCRNVITNVKNKAFLRDFRVVSKMICTPREFDERWHLLVKKHSLQSNSWVTDLYNKRRKWAEAFLRGHFFAGMRSTQRSESLNAIAKCYLKSRLLLYPFFKRFEIVIAKIRENELKDYCITAQSSPVLKTHLRELEAHASEIFTRKIFCKVQIEIETEAILSVYGLSESNGVKSYTITRYLHEGCKWVVLYNRPNKSLQCTCKKFESEGIPCSHQIAVMKAENFLQFLGNCINRRWTKVAKPENKWCYSEQLPSNMVQTARYGVLNAISNRMNFYAGKTNKGYEQARVLMSKYTLCLKSLWESECINSKSADKFRNENGLKIDPTFDTLDPNVVAAKGRKVHKANMKRKPRHCKCCRLIGHDKRNCPKLGHYQGSGKKSNQDGGDIYEKRVHLPIPNEISEDYSSGMNSSSLNAHIDANRAGSIDEASNSSW